MAQVQVTEILRVQKNQGYSPSRSELRDWYLAVNELGDEKALGKIEAIGRRLNDAYCDDYGGGTGGDAIGQSENFPSQDNRALIFGCAISRLKVQYSVMTLLMKAISIRKPV